MEKERVLTRKEIEGLRESMQGEWRGYMERAHASSRRSMRAFQDERRQARRGESEARARFLFEHGEQLAGLVRNEPRFMLRLALDRLPPDAFEWPPIGLPPREALQQGKWWARIEATLAKEHLHLYLGPVLDVYGTFTIDVGSRYTVPGLRLGTAAGTATLIDCNGVRHTLTIVSWSETGVEFDVPANLSRIPFDCAGQLEIVLADGTVLTTPVTIQPLAPLFYSTDSYSAHDWGTSRYTNNHTFQSAALPSSFRQFTVPDLAQNPHAGCVSFRTHNDLNTSIDGPVHVAVTGGPSVDSGVIKVWTRLTDDYYWNFTVYADFYIEVPQGISAPGWTSA